MMKKWKSGISMLMAAAMIMGNMTLAVPVMAEPTAGMLVNGGFEEDDLNGWTKNGWCTDGGASMERVGSNVIQPAEGSYCLRGSKRKRVSGHTGHCPDTGEGLLAHGPDLPDYRQFLFYRIP